MDEFADVAFDVVGLDWAADDSELIEVADRRSCLRCESSSGSKA